MAITNKSGLENVLNAVLSVGNAEQSSSYPPFIYDNHYNIVTSFLLDAAAQLYPDKVDIFLNFLQYKKIPVTSGYVQLPPEYRNLVGAPSITVKPDGTDCGSDKPTIDTASEFKTANLKAGCKTRPIEIVSKEEWDYRTTSTYAFPTYENPIGLFIAERRIKVCPYDLTSVEVTYLKKEKLARYSYITQPDDTFIFDAANSIEVGWEEAAFKPLFKGCLSLYSAYSRDKTISDYSQILNQANLF